MKKTLTDMKEDIVSSISSIVIGDFDTPPSRMGRITRQKINKEIQEWNSSREQLNPTNTYKALHPKTQSYTTSLVPLGHCPHKTHVSPQNKSEYI